MSLKERTINVDIMTKEYTKLKYKQGDSNQILKFKFYKNGSELDLTGYVAGIFYEKPNNEILEKTGNISSNTVTTTITNGVLNTAGTVKTEIFLTKNDEVSISFTILIEVESSIDKNAAVQEKEEWDIIKDLLINGNNISIIDDSLTSTNKTWSSSKISSQIKEISKVSDLEIDTNNNIHLINEKSEKVGNGVVIETGKPTDEQVATVINQAIANGDIVAGGLTSTAQTLLISILRNAVFTSNQSASITSLQSELAKSNSGSSGTTQYVITNTLNNATTSNSASLVDANSSYTATITINEGYALDTITVTMGGTDITNTAVSGTTITIASVTGDVVITVTTTESGGSSSGEMVTDGLVNYFDFRTATYNNSGAGGSTIISATQGNGSLFSWANNVVNAQDDYGISNTRAMIYNADSVGTTDTSCGNAFTWIFKCYMYGGGSPFFSTDYGIGNTNYVMQYKPKYNTSSGTAQDTALYDSLGATPTPNTYNTWSIVVDGNICKLYKDSTLMNTRDGSAIDGFVSWYNKLTCNVLVGTGKGKITQLAVYNKALNEVEITDMIEYLSTLEVK